MARRLGLKRVETCVLRAREHRRHGRVYTIHSGTVSDPIRKRSPPRCRLPAAPREINANPSVRPPRPSGPPSSRGDVEGGAQPTEATAEAVPSEEVAVNPLTAATAECARLKDMWMRTAADFDNFESARGGKSKTPRRAGKRISSGKSYRCSTTSSARSKAPNAPPTSRPYRRVSRWC